MINLRKKDFMSLILLNIALVGCGGSSSSSDTSSGIIDITNKTFTNKSANCEDYVASYSSTSTDVQNDNDFTGALTISTENGKCIFTSNIIPNHNFNASGDFAEATAEQSSSSVEITSSPAVASSVTYLAVDDNGIFLNGVKLSIRSAGCYGVGDGSIGCNKSDQPFRYDPLGATGHFGADEHNAHTQPGGAYHYHGSPLAMYDQTGSVESPVIGFARDGYPIFGSYFTDNGSVRKAVSSYQLKSGTRSAVIFEGTTYNPSGTYDGTYVDDWKYVEGAGDLDECNGMTVDGVYGYYVIDAFPWVLNCYKGTPDDSFGHTAP